MLSENLKKIRKDNNLSQEQLAEKLGVSRQSVSKWENGEAYPEMDKVLQLCKMFNLNIDELLNQDIKEVNENKQRKIYVDKYVGDFLDYITKVINLFSSMKFRDIVKCLIEQSIIGSIIFSILSIIGLVGGNFVHSILFFIPHDIYYDVYNIFSGLYSLFAFIVGLCLMLHIFKKRYLDYFVIEDNKVEESSKKEIEEKDEVKEKKKVFERKEEKVIIRDPKDSQNGFISLLVKSILFMIKMFVLLLGISFSVSLIGFVVAFVLSFVIAKSGLVFIGILLLLLGCIFINLVILNLIYNFLRSIKSKAKLMMFIFTSSLILFGVGVGLTCLGFLDFEYINEDNNPNYIESTEVLKMKEDYYIEHMYNVEFIESSNSDLKIVFVHPDFHKVECIISNGSIWFNDYDVDGIKIINRIIDDFNDRKIMEYGYFKVKVYTNKENINKLKENRYNQYHRYDD